METTNFKIGDRVKDTCGRYGTIVDYAEQRTYYDFLKDRKVTRSIYIVELDDGRIKTLNETEFVRINNSDGLYPRARIDSRTMYKSNEHSTEETLASLAADYLDGLGARNEYSHDTHSTEEQIAYLEAENRRLFSKLYVKLLYKELLDIKDVIFNNPATIVLWADGTKTVVKAGGDDVYDPEKGLAMCFVKKALGNKGSYYDKIKEWLPIPYEPVEHNECESIDSLTKKFKDIQKKYDIDSADVNKYGDAYDTRLFYAGTKHKIVCAGDCYHVKNIKKTNRLTYFSLQDALDSGCTPCKHCNGKHKVVENNE